MCTMLTTSKNQQRARYYWWTPYSKAVDVSFSSHFSFPCDVMIVKFDAKAKSSLSCMTLMWFFIKFVFLFPHKFTQFLCSLLKFTFFIILLDLLRIYRHTFFIKPSPNPSYLHLFDTFTSLKLRDWKIHLCLINFSFYFYMLGVGPIFVN